MLHLDKYFVLNQSFKREFNEAIIQLKLETELSFVKILGLIEFENGIIITEEFEKKGNLWVAEHELAIENLPFARTLKVSLVLFNDGLQKTTNKVLLEVNTAGIGRVLKKFHSDIVKDLAIRLAKLENITDNATKKGLISNKLLIKEQEIKPGMIPVATIGGGFTAAYPFFDFVKTINEVAAVNEHIELTLSDIKLSDKNTNAEKVVQLLLQVVKEQASVLQNILATQQKLAEEIKELELKLAEHLSTALF